MLLKNANILVIDDDEDVLIALRLLLKSMVNSVTVNKNPNAINDLLQQQNFDVVILDMNFNGLVNTGNEGIFWLQIQYIKFIDPWRNDKQGCLMDIFRGWFIVD